MRGVTLNRSIRAAGIAAALLCGALGSTPVPALACTCPARAEVDCLRLASSGVGSPYAWGGARWSTKNRSWGGADCSGFVVKAWQVPRTSAITEQYHPYGTYHLFNNSTHWYAVSRASVWFADAVGYPDPDGSGSATGHVVLYDGGDPYGLALVYEAPGSGMRIRHAWRDISAPKWRFRRRHNMRRTLYMA